MREVRLEAGFQIELTSLRTRRRVGCTVDKLLGVGGTAKVYSGITDDGHQVVLKAQRYEGQVDPSFEVEVELFKKLFHRNIVHCVGVAHTSGGHLVLGFRRAYQNPLLLLNKASVERRDRRATYPSLPIDTAIDFAYELLNSLDYLERLGFVHHDVKLANILVDVSPRDRPLTGGEVFGEVVRRSYRGVLIDFGATRSRAYLEAWNRGEAPDGLAPLITPIYAPPEALVETRQPDGEVRVTFDPSLDVYAAALVIYALVTGHPPYSHLRAKLDLNDIEGVIAVKSAERREELHPISREVIQRVVFEDTRFVTGDRSSFDMALLRFLSQRLHPDPAQRGTAADMKRDFERLACIRQLRDDAPPPSNASGRSGGSSTASASRPVFLPFQQELVVVGTKGGEHPLLRAARSFGVGAGGSAEGDGAGRSTSPEPPTPTPEGETASASEDELDWLASIGNSQDPSVTSIDADASWLDEMDATGTPRPTGPPAARGTRRLGSEPAGSPLAPSADGARQPEAPRGPEAAAPRGPEAAAPRGPEAAAPRGPEAAAPPRRPRRPDESGSHDGAPALRPARGARGGASAASGRRPASSGDGQASSASGRAPAVRPATSESGRNLGPPQARPPARSLAERGPPPPSMGFAPHCLTGSALGDAVLLSRERRYVVGRDPAAELRIRSDLVSRRHAEVSWAGEYFQVTDLGSLNGTLVNGERITRPTPLHDGDRIGVGGFELAVRTLQSGELPGIKSAEGPAGAGETRLMSPGGEPPSAPTAFAGDLKKLPLREVLRLIETRRQSGTLDVRPPRGTPGKLHFRGGSLVHAELRGVPPRQAALRLLGLQEGRFVFSGGEPRCPRSIDVPHEALWAEVGGR